MPILPATIPIPSAKWQLSIAEAGKVVTDDDATGQSIRILLATDPGTDVMRPDFGIGLLAMIGRPITEVRTALKVRGEAQFRDYLPEVKVEGYTVAPITDGGDGGISVTVHWSPNKSTTINI